MPIVRKRIDDAKIDTVLSNSFGFGGTNATLVFQRYSALRDLPDMDGLMKGKRGLIMGVANDHSIAWGIAKKLAEHGAELAFTYQGEAFGRRVKPLADKLGAIAGVPCDVEDSASVAAVFETLGSRMGQARLRRPRHRLLRQERAQGPLRRHQPRQFHPHHGDLLLLLHRGRPPCRGADGRTAAR